MRIHTDKLTRRDLWCALAAAGPDVYIEPYPTEHRSRSRARAFDVRLAADRDSGPWRNSGQHGAERVRAASWEEWGRFLALLFLRDPAARCWAYDGAADFHAKTSGKFRRSDDAPPGMRRMTAADVLGARADV